MILLTKQDEKFNPMLERFDPELFGEIENHTGVLKETVCLAWAEKRGEKLAGVAYLVKDVENFFRLVMKTDSDNAAEAVFAMLPAVLKKAGQCLRQNPSGEIPVLRIWCSEKQKDYMEFLQSYGFEKKDEMLVMQKTITKTEPKSPNVRRMDFGKPGMLTLYLKGTKEGFGYSDLREEVLYRIKSLHAEVYAYHIGDSPVSFVMTWKKNSKAVMTESIFTLKKVRGHGYASETIRSVLNESAQKGYKKAELSVYQKDEGAISLYRKLGYRKKDRLYELHWEVL